MNTTPSAHRKGERLGLLDVDTWPAFVRYDQDTDIQDETARRIADIYHQTGPYEMVYFDGAEDVHEPYWYHVASAQHRVFRLLNPPPAVCEAAHYTHYSWHMITRSNAYDIVAPADGMKDFCRLMPCPTAAARAIDFSRIQFGWLGRFGNGKGGCAGPDVWEYVVSRAAAWDCPIALKTSLEEIASNPRREDCLDVIKTWEDARLGNHLSPAQREMLKNVAPQHARYVPCFEQRGIWEDFLADRNLSEAQRAILADRREHHLFINERGRYELVPVDEIPDVAEGSVKAYTFTRAVRPNDAYLLVWAVDDEVKLRLPLAPDRLSRMRPFGHPLPVDREGNRAVVSISNREYLVLPGTSVDQAGQILRGAQLVP